MSIEKNHTNWVDWNEFMPPEKADDYTFGSFTVLEKFMFLLGKQALILKGITMPDDPKRIVAAYPLIIGMESNARAVIKLAQKGFVNETYPIFRSLFEKIVTFYYLQVCDDDEFKNYIDYSKQKTYRVATRELSIHDKKFSLKYSGIDLEKNPELKKSVEKYTGPKSGKPITRWSNTSIEKKLEVINASGFIKIDVMMITLVAIFDDASEALHATLYGCTFHWGTYDTGQEIKKPEDILDYQLHNLTMAIFLFGLLLGEVNQYVIEKLVCLQKVLDRSGLKIREGFRFQIPSFDLLSNL